VVGDDPVEVETEVEVAIVITIMVVMHQPSRRRCTTLSHRHRIATGAVDFLTITRTDLRHTPLGRLHHTNTGRDTDRVAPVHTRLSPRMAETLLTQMAVGGTHRGRRRTAGAAITLDRRAEVATVEVAVGDIMAVVVVVVAVAAVAAAAVVAVVMVMETAEEDSATPHRIRTATMPTMVATAQAAVARLEGAVEVEVTKFLAIVRIRLGHFYACLPTFSLALFLVYMLTSSGFVCISQSDQRYSSCLAQ
jgi:phosphoribosylformylglycinamidine (FGAM) synthase-like enzyme